MGNNHIHILLETFKITNIQGSTSTKKEKRSNENMHSACSFILPGPLDSSWPHSKKVNGDTYVASWQAGSTIRQDSNPNPKPANFSPDLRAP